MIEILLIVRRVSTLTIVYMKTPAETSFFLIKRLEILITINSESKDLLANRLILRVFN